MTGNARYVILSVTEKVIWSQEEDMPVAFTEEQQAEIRKKLYDAAKNMVIDTPYHAIKVEELTKAAGISKGAFYKFYPAKELLFYEILRSLHEELFSSAMENFTASQDQSAEENLCRTLLDCYDSVHTSRYRRFWMKDSLKLCSHSRGKENGADGSRKRAVSEISESVWSAGSERRTCIYFSSGVDYDRLQQRKAGTGL